MQVCGLDRIHHDLKTTYHLFFFQLKLCYQYNLWPWSFLNNPVSVLSSKLLTLCFCIHVYNDLSCHSTLFTLDFFFFFFIVIQYLFVFLLSNPEPTTFPRLPEELQEREHTGQTQEKELWEVEQLLHIVKKMS